MILAPFPWFGGKSEVADVIWSRLGSDIGTYIEPFAGSCAVALNRPRSFRGWITLNDLDGFISNFWRAMKSDPCEVAKHAASPVNECDLHARHLWLVNNRDRITGRLMADPDWFDARAAGWWAWGCCCYIGSGWCAGDGPWSAVPDDEGVPSLTRNGGRGVKKKLPHLGNGGQGVNKQLPHLGDGGKGVNKQLPHLGDGGKAAQREEWLNAWFAKLSDLLFDARVCCGSWERVCSVGTMTRNGVAGILLDPPYSQTKAVYAKDDSSVSAQVRAWCVKNGDNPILRIALCGHAGEGHEELEALGWSTYAWGSSGYQGADNRERIWFSPACLQATLFD